MWILLGRLLKYPSTLIPPPPTLLAERTTAEVKVVRLDALSISPAAAAKVQSRLF